MLNTVKFIMTGGNRCEIQCGSGTYGYRVGKGNLVAAFKPGGFPNYAGGRKYDSDVDCQIEYRITNRIGNLPSVFLKFFVMDLIKIYEVHKKRELTRIGLFQQSINNCPSGILVDKGKQGAGVKKIAHNSRDFSTVFSAINRSSSCPSVLHIPQRRFRAYSALTASNALHRKNGTARSVLERAGSKYEPHGSIPAIMPGLKSSRARVPAEISRFCSIVMFLLCGWKSASVKAKNEE